LAWHDDIDDRQVTLRAVVQDIAIAALDDDRTGNKVIRNHPSHQSEFSAWRDYRPGSFAEHAQWVKARSIFSVFEVFRMSKVVSRRTSKTSPRNSSAWGTA
jgi:hypothetical protein